MFHTKDDPHGLRDTARGWLEATGVPPTEEDIDAEVIHLHTEMDRLDWEDWVLGLGLEPYGPDGPLYPGLGKWR